jgi:hypothetical protein
MFPIINIHWNKYLDPVFIAYIRSYEKYQDWVVPSDEATEAKTKAFVEIWAKDGKKILTAMQHVTGLSFARNRIDISIVKGNPRSHSNPIVIRSGWTPEEFLEVLTHELIHNLVADNEAICQHNWKPWTQIVEKYGSEPKLVKNHILVYFIMNKVTELTGIEFKRNLEDTETNLEYKRAVILAQTVSLEF